MKKSSKEERENDKIRKARRQANMVEKKKDCRIKIKQRSMKEKN